MEQEWTLWQKLYKHSGDWYMSAARSPTPSPEQPSDGHLRARERKTWWHTVEKDLNIRGLSLDMARRAAADRAR